MTPCHIRFSGANLRTPLIVHLLAEIGIAGYRAL
jgi:hypothetical protein